MTSNYIFFALCSVVPINKLNRCLKGKVIRVLKRTTTQYIWLQCSFVVPDLVFGGYWGRKACWIFTLGCKDFILIWNCILNLPCNVVDAIEVLFISIWNASYQNKHINWYQYLFGYMRKYCKRCKWYVWLCPP